MSGTCTFMLRSVLEDITVELSEVTCTNFDEEKSMMYLGMRSGEIVVLKIIFIGSKATAQPSLFLSPGFEVSSSHVVAMTVAEMPFSLMTDSCEQALVSIYSDGRIRLWDLRDGKCVMVSRENKFIQPKSITKLGPIHENHKRFLYVVESGSNVYFIDLWALRTHKLLSGDLVPIVACCFDEVALFALDKDEKIKVYDLMALQKSEFFDYEFFLTSAEEMNMIIKGYQNLPIQLGFAPQRNNDMLINDLILPITNFLDPPIDYWMNKKYIYILYTKKIMIYVRKELLTLGKLKSFEKMNSTLGEYSYITWELELENKRVHRGYPQKNDSLLVMLDVDTNKSEL